LFALGYEPLHEPFQEKEPLQTGPFDLNLKQNGWAIPPPRRMFTEMNDVFKALNEANVTFVILRFLY
jgi:hypothetical protein